MEKRFFTVDGRQIFEGDIILQGSVYGIPMEHKIEGITKGYVIIESDLFGITYHKKADLIARLTDSTFSIKGDVAKVKTWEDIKTAYKECPACSSKEYTTRTDRHGNLIRTCQKCLALYGDFFKLAESYEQVKPRFSDKPVETDNIRYFDFTGLTEKGLQRRHGYYDVTTLLLDQIG